MSATIVVDEDGIYDPADFNDALLLGLRGTMAQAELHFMRGRLLGGKLKVLATIDQHIGIPWVARSGLEPEIVDGLRQGLLSLLPVSSQDSTGFEKVEDRSYEYMRVAIEMEMLNADHRKVIILARVRELPMREVARIMERTPEAAGMLLVRALMKLKAHFGPTESLEHPKDMTLDESGRVLE